MMVGLYVILCNLMHSCANGFFIKNIHHMNIWKYMYVDALCGATPVSVYTNYVNVQLNTW